MNAPAERANAVALPLITWMLIQLAAIALAASRVPLSANFPTPAHGLALHEMLIAQFVGSAILLPVLFRGWRSWLVMVVTAALMLTLAATMTPTPIGRVMSLWLHVAVWLTALAVWRVGLPRRTDVLTAAATLLTAGGSLLGYLGSEFHPSGPTIGSKTLPLVAALDSIASPTPLWSPLPSTSAILLAAGLVILAITGRFRRESDQFA